MRKKMSDGNVTTYEFVALAPFDVATRNDMLLWFNTNKTNMKLLEIVGVEWMQEIYGRLREIILIKFTISLSS